MFDTTHGGSESQHMEYRASGCRVAPTFHRESAARLLFGGCFMETPPQILWHEADEPSSFVDDVQRVPDGTVCATCGGAIDVGLLLDDTFTGNEDGWPYFADMSSEWVCRGCDYLSNGRWKDQFRLWSILWCEDGGLPDHYPSVYDQWGDDVGYPVRLRPLVEHGDDRVQITSRGGVYGIVSLLLDPPKCRWFAAISESGQKKIHRFAPMTSGDPYEVQFEYQTVRMASTDFARALFDVASLRALGVSEERIRSGQLDPTYDRDHAARARWHSHQLDDVRGHPRMELALFCCTEDSTDDIGRRAGRALIRRGTTRSGGPLAAGDAAVGVDRRHRAERLVAARAGGAGGGGGDEREPPADGLQNGGQTGDRGAGQADSTRDQLDLF